jgi:hypothetical protein
MLGLRRDLVSSGELNMVAMSTGEPVGEPETLFWPPISENAATRIGSSTAPMTGIRPF